jgi:CHAD domain-containing protein
VAPSDGQLTKVGRMVEDIARSREGKLAAAAVTAAAAVVAVRQLRGGSSEDDRLAHARRYRLRTDEPVGRGTRRVALARIDDAVELLRDPEVAQGTAVHEARKDMKKLRSALRLVRPVIGDAIYRRQNERFRDAGRSLSAARDAKVLAETIDALTERFADDPPPGGWDSVREALTVVVADDGDLDDLRRSAAAEIESGRREIQTLPLPGRPNDVLRPGLQDVYRRGRRRLREAVEQPTDERLHELRKRVKDLWYHLRLLRDGSPELVKPLEDGADALSDLLGDDHDLAVLAAKLDAADSIDGDQRRHIHRLIDARRSELQGKALPDAKRLYKRKPKAFAKRLTEPWEAATG